MIPVEKFLDGQDKKPVYLHVYSYFDSVLEQFNQPIIDNNDPDFMAASVRAGLLKGTFKQEQASGLKLVYLGKFCIQTGEFELLEHGQIIIDCDRYFKEARDVN